MSEIYISVNDQELHITSAPLISAGGIKENYVNFDFSSEWSGFLKIAVFHHSEAPDTKYQSVCDINGRALIPHEVTAKKGTLFISVNGINDDVILTSDIVKYKIVAGEYLETEPSSPDIYDQFLEMAETVHDAVNAINEARAITKKRFDQTFTISSNTSSLTFSPTDYAYDESDRFEVYVNGLKLTDSEFSTSDASVDYEVNAATITFATPIAGSEEIVEVVCYKDIVAESDIEEKVNSWLDDHPEATTTVQDGSITPAKLNSDLRNTITEIPVLSQRVDNLLDESRPGSVTTLWTGSINKSGDSATLSENVSAFDFLDIYLLSNTDTKFIRVPASQTSVQIQSQNMSDDGSSPFLYLWETGVGISGTTVTINKCVLWSWINPTQGSASYDSPTVTANAENGPAITRIDGFKMSDESPAELLDIRVGADGTTYETAGAAVRGQITEITAEMVKVKSNNYAKSDSDVTAGYVAQNGVIYEASSLWYTKPISVNEGDVVRLYTFASGGFTVKSMRFVCAYNSEGQAVSASGTENTYAYTVPSGIASVVLTSAGVAANVNQLMITRNYEPSEYEPYFEPYYIAGEGFVKNVLDNYNIPESTVKGYNLIPASDNGEGYYYGISVGSKIKFQQETLYRYAIMPVKKNTDYYCSANARFWAFTDDKDIVTSYGKNSVPLNSGNGTKLYCSFPSSVWNNESQYGHLYAIVVSEGISGTYNNVKKPSFVSGISQNMMDAKYGCALPKKRLVFTVNQPQTWYYKNMLALSSNEVGFGIAGYGSYVDGGIEINPNTVQGNSDGGYYYRVYDERLSCVSQLSHRGIVIYADNLQSCSVLVIGDSTVAQNYLTSKMLDEFTGRDKTLTLLGTLGTSPNKHEGRSGWSAKQYCTVESSGGVLNPFYNPESNKFDFAYYMANQGYASVDFVVIQLGINDLYNASFETADDSIKSTANYIKEMVDSALAFNPAQKILLNLPTALNEDQTKQYHLLSATRNIFVRYNEYIQYLLNNYNTSVLRFSHCHLILDPRTDIRDNVHPTETGYAKMANEVVSQINCWQNA